MLEKYNAKINRFKLACKMQSCFSSCIQ